MIEKIYSIYCQNTIEVNTDPQRRCYNGCHFTSSLVLGPWKILESEISESKIEHKMKFWRELNDYAVSQRGESARTEYKMVENNK